MSIQVSTFFQPKKYLRRSQQIINSYILSLLDCVTAPPFEKTFAHPPIFFLGAPRSGSTLMFQVITDALDVAYLSNQHCRYFGSPTLANHLLNPLKGKNPSDYTSHHGVTKGQHGPSECGEWWYRFFRRDPAYVTLADVDESKMRCFRRSLLAFAEATNKPLMFKNLYASLRLEAISKYIPEALFIWIKRNTRDNAHSILESRMRVQGRYDQWWSVPPPNVDNLKLLDPAQQVVGQIKSVHHLIQKSIDDKLIHHDRVLILNYEEFCSDVHAAITQVVRFFSHHNVIVHKRFQVPNQFPVRSGLRIPPQLYEQLLEITGKKFQP